MKQLNTTQITLLQILGDGACHSGSELGEALGISRTAIWKQINQLMELNIQIIRLPQQGYQLKGPLILLDEQHILNQLHTKGFSTQLNFHLFSTLDSTNRYLKDLPISSQLDICCAELQTQGRGRFGRHWHSPFGENIYCSSRWNLNADLTSLSGLSLVASLAVLATLNALDLSSDIKIKWPNDILWQDKKLCGSLIEINAESHGNAQIIIGIGININSDTQNNPLPDKPWCSLYEITGQNYNRNQIITDLIINLEHYLTKFLANGLTAFMSEWNQADYLFGKHITVTQSTGSLTGVACGINQVGQLILEGDDGVRHELSSGDTSLQSMS